jgi:long-chain acyl-CoA synthetase
MPETIPALFFRQAQVHARRPLFFVKRAGTYQPITWEQAREDIFALGTFLLAQQVNAGDRVLLLSESRPEWGLADLAIQAVGAWTVSLYPNLTEQDARTICRDCQPVLAVASTSVGNDSV